MSWKKYGGTNKLDKLNNISVNTIVTDKFTLKEFYVGDWDICGGLNVKDDAIIRGNLFVQYKVTIIGDLDVSGSFNASNTNIFGDLFVSKSAYIRDSIYLDPSSNTLFKGLNKKFGLNTANPQATLDISSNLERTLDIHTSATNNKNVVARNAANQGITVNVEPTKAYIDFYLDNSMNLSKNARLMYEPGGKFTIDVSNIVKFKPRVVFSQDTAKEAVADERVAIYDNAAATVPYFPAIYGDSTFKTGTALNLIAGDNSSNVFFRMATEQGKGLTLGGGAGPGNQIMGTLALIDPSNVKYPAFNVFSGILTQNLKTAIGVNKHDVKINDDVQTNKYAMDINGPVKVAHEELLLVQDASFQVYATANVGSTVYAVGGPTTVVDSSNQFFLKSTDGGYTWTRRRILDGSSNPFTIETQAIFNTIHAIDGSDILIGAENGIFRTENGGTSWSAISKNGGDIVNPGALFVTNESTKRLLIGLSTGSSNAGSIINNNTTWFDGSKNYSPGATSTGLSAVFGIHGYGNVVAIAGQGGVVPYKVDAGLFGVKFGCTMGTCYTFYDVHSVYDGTQNHVVAVGAGAIIYSHNFKYNIPGGFNSISWSDVSLAGVTLRKVRVLSTTCAIAVGNAGAIYYSINGYATWSRADANGMGNGLTLTASNLLTLSATSINDFIICTDNKKVFNLYSPYLLNRANHNVIEASGNMVLSGDVRIQDAGVLYSNSIDALPGSALTVAGSSNILYLGNAGGNVEIRGNLTLPTSVTSTNINNLEIKNKTILLNDEALGNGVSAFTGIMIRDNSADNLGYMLQNGTMDGFLFKGTQSGNRVNLDVSGLNLADGSTQKIVMLVPNTVGDVSADYTITARTPNITDISSLDASLNRRVERDVGNTTATVQVVSTGLLASGGLYAGKTVANIIANTQLDISGNCIASRIGLGTTSIDTNYALDVSGNSRFSGQILQW